MMTLGLQHGGVIVLGGEILQLVTVMPEDTAFFQRGLNAVTLRAKRLK